MRKNKPLIPMYWYAKSLVIPKSVSFEEFRDYFKSGFPQGMIEETPIDSDSIFNVFTLVVPVELMEKLRDFVKDFAKDNDLAISNISEYDKIPASTFIAPISKNIH